VGRPRRAQTSGSALWTALPSLVLARAARAYEGFLPPPKPGETFEQRVREQDQDGMDAEVLFAAMVAGPVFWRNIAHDEVYKAVIRGYNDWLGEEYCAVAPDRLIGMGVIPITNVDDAIAEMKHCKKLGLKGILLGGLPSGKGYPTPEDDRFWAAALDLDMPVTVHVQLYRTGARANQPTMKYPKEDPVVMARLRRPFLEWLTNFGLPPSIGMAQLVLSGVFERFPKLKIFFAETRLGWVPFWLEHMDLWYQRHLGWAQEYLGFKPLKALRLAADPLLAAWHTAKRYHAIAPRAASAGATVAADPAVATAPGADAQRTATRVDPGTGATVHDVTPVVAGPPDPVQHVEPAEAPMEVR